MAVTVIMPKLGMAMTEGTLVEWAKEDGASVAKDDPIATIMSEKITYEVVAPSEGVLRHAVAENDVIPIGLPIGYVCAVGEPIPTAPAELRPEPVVAVATATAESVASAPVARQDRHVLATPVARRLAQEYEVDLESIQGTGPGGRIQESDVQDYVARHPREAIPLPSANCIPFRGMRRAIAEGVVESLRTMAQVTITTEADVTPLVELRERLKKTSEVTLTTLIVKATATALRQHPLLNATLAGDEIRLLPDVNLGVGVALEAGLIVPVIRAADRLAVDEVDRELKRLAGAARSGSLRPEDVLGGTFSITNLGMYGVDAFTPVINPGQVGILGVGRVVEKAAVYRGELARRSMLVLSLTFDHRVVDGAPAAAFLQTLREMLEQPALMLAGAPGPAEPPRRAA